MDAKKIELDDDAYEAILNEIYGTVSVCGMTFDAGRVLRELDPIAFDVSLSDYDSENERYECGECNTEFDNEDDAEECCRTEEDEDPEEDDDDENPEEKTEA